jgi:DNA invertase Pin-like site-specific DNA recombinase
VSALLGYARISTSEQLADLQHDALAAAGVPADKVFTDTASGRLDRRPQLDALLAYAREGDTIVVWRLDRLGRSIKHLIELATVLEERGIGLRSLQEQIDTTTANGRLVFHVFGALAEFERSLLSERTRAGLAAARARGRRGGRPPTVTPDKLELARRLVDERKMTMQQIADALGVGRSTLYRALDTAPSTTSQKQAG